MSTQAERDAQWERWEAEKARKAAEVAKYVEEMFVNDDNFSAINTPENREAFLKHVLDATFYGEVRVEYCANEKQVQDWLDDTIRIVEASRDNPEWLKSLLIERSGDLSTEESQPFKDWMLDKIYEDEPEVCTEHVYETARAIVRKIENGNNEDLANVVREMEISDLVESLESYYIIHSELEILEPVVKANILLGTPDEINHEFTNIPYLCEALEKDYEARNFIEDRKFADAMMHNALNYLAMNQGTSLANILDTEKDIPDDHKKFVNSVREEFENHVEGYGHLLTALTRTKPDDLYKMLISPSMHINKNAVLGLYGPSGTGSVLGIELGEKGAYMPTGLVYDIEIEKGGRRLTLDNVYGMSGSAWKDNAVTGSDIKMETKPDGVEEFVSLVEKRMESREDAADDIAPGY